MPEDNDDEDYEPDIPVFACQDCGAPGMLLALDGRVICENCGTVIGGYRIGSLGLDVN